jgi:hypothetical protein
MNEATPIPIETEVPKHRGEAYTEFEKGLSSISQTFNFYEMKRIKCISINFYPEGEPIEDEITSQEEFPSQVEF